MNIVSLTIIVYLLLPVLLLIISYIFSNIILEKLRQNKTSKETASYKSGIFIFIFFITYQLLISVLFKKFTSINDMQLILLHTLGIKNSYLVDVFRFFFRIIYTIINFCCIIFPLYNLDKYIRETDWKFKLYATYNLSFLLLFMLLFIINTLSFLTIKHFLLPPMLYLVIPVLTMLLVYIFFPFIFMFFMRTKPLKDENIRSLFEGILNKNNIKYKNIHIWPSRGGKIVNAMISGIFPKFRYIFISSFLLEKFEEKEIKSILGHELGHAKFHHLFFFFCLFMMFLSIFVTIMILVESLFGKYSDITNVISIISSLAFLLFAFPFISRIFEHQSDEYGAYLTSVDDMSSALDKLGKLNYYPAKESKVRESTQTHPSIHNRIKYIKEKGERFSYNSGIINNLSKTNLTIAIVMLFISALSIGSIIYFEEKSIQRKIEKYKAKNSYWKIGGLLLDNERYSESISAYEKALPYYTDKKDVGSLFYNIGLCYDNLYKYDKALYYYKKSVELYPDYDGIKALANIHFKIGDYKNAKEEYENVLLIKQDEKISKKRLILLNWILK